MRILSASWLGWLRLPRSSDSLTRVIADVAARRKTRRALGMLDDHLLDDIGLTRLSAQSEASRRFWRD